MRLSDCRCSGDSFPAVKRCRGARARVPLLRVAFISLCARAYKLRRRRWQQSFSQRKSSVRFSLSFHLRERPSAPLHYPSSSGVYTLFSPAAPHRPLVPFPSRATGLTVKMRLIRRRAKKNTHSLGRDTANKFPVTNAEISMTSR